MLRWCRMSRMMLICTPMVAVLLSGCAAPGKPAAKVEKIRVARADDLPKHTYPLTGKVTDLVRSEEQVAALAKKVRADIEGDLAAYQIDDPTTLQRLYSTLLTADLLARKYDAAQARIEQIRGLESKEAKSL